MCSKCGGPNVTPDASRTNLDARYPIGFCDRCTPEPKSKLRPGTDGSRPDHWVVPARRTIPLVRADLDDPADREHRHRVEHARTLARKLHDPKSNARMPEAERRQASEAVAWLRRAE